jgi:hypothetical protein
MLLFFLKLKIMSQVEKLKEKIKDYSIEELTARMNFAKDQINLYPIEAEKSAWSMLFLTYHKEIRDRLKEDFDIIF